MRNILAALLLALVSASPAFSESNGSIVLKNKTAKNVTFEIAEQGAGATRSWLAPKESTTLKRPNGRLFIKFHNEGVLIRNMRSMELHAGACYEFKLVASLSLTELDLIQGCN